MKTILILSLYAAALLAMLHAPGAAANDAVNSSKWNTWCQANKRKCEQALMMCEEYPKVNCDDIRLAFMQRRPLDNILPKD
jgi:hypothetical protein